MGKDGNVINRNLGNMTKSMRLASWSRHVLKKTWALWMKW